MQWAVCLDKDFIFLQQLKLILFMPKGKYKEGEFFFYWFNGLLIQQALTSISTYYMAGPGLRLGVQWWAEMVTITDVTELSF